MVPVCSVSHCPCLISLLPVILKSPDETILPAGLGTSFIYQIEIKIPQDTQSVNGDTSRSRRASHTVVHFSTTSKIHNYVVRICLSLGPIRRRRCKPGFDRHPPPIATPLLVLRTSDIAEPELQAPTSATISDWLIPLRQDRYTTVSASRAL